MEVFRIVKEQYAGELTASGRAGRWNMKDQWVLYTSSSRALATLELLVHCSQIPVKSGYRVLVIEISDHSMSQIAMKDLPKQWRNLNAYSQLQMIGSEWYSRGKSLLLEVPSAIIPQEKNYLINTRHTLFEQKVSISRKENYFWDERM